MPELPEVERVRLTLTPHLVGRTMARARLHRPDICECFSAGAKGIKKVRCTRAALLEGETVQELRRHGKQLAIIARSGRVLCVHLGMSGQLRWKAKGARVKPTHVHAEWFPVPKEGVLEGHLVFRDPRRFGGLWTFESLEALHRARWDSLGPDALTLTAAQLRENLGASKRPIKAALLDQRVIAGVGNIYADEALFLSGVAPVRPANALSRGELTKLARNIPVVLRRSIATGGSTLRDYVDGDGKMGKAQERNAVYGRSGKACLVCGTPLRTAQVGQRTTVWCPECQH